jgi:uncharacterized protein (TIGR03437 family)
MAAIPGLLAALLAGLFVCVTSQAAEEATRQAPTYTAASVVNAATNQTGPLAPFALVSIYGKELSFTTRAISPADISNGILPLAIPGAGVQVTIDLVLAPLIFVSPTQINFLIPATIRPGRRTLRVARSGLEGPAVQVDIAAAAPGLFTSDGAAAIAVRADGSLVTAETPASPGDVVLLFATGLGATTPSFDALAVPDRAAVITRLSEFDVLLNGTPMAASNILYAGVTPGFAGLYQINLRLPEGTPPGPEVQLRIGESTSPRGLRLPTRLQ